jgi:Ca2+-binding RTX toxin-like protein
MADIKEDITSNDPNTHAFGAGVAVGEIITVYENKKVSATGSGSNGIHLTPGSNYLNLKAGSSVSSALGVGVSLGGSGNTLFNEGAITGVTGVVVRDINTYGHQITNFGYIGGISNLTTGYNGWGIVLADSATINNYGTIEGTYIGIGAAYTSLEGMTVNNYGTIKSISGYYAVYAPVAYPTTFINSGYVNGSIELGISSDLYDGRQGRVEGEIGLGLGDDRAFGGAGTEIYEGNSGNDTIDGGGGNDTAMFRYARSLYSITKTNGGVIIQDTADNDGTDLLKGVRFAKFDDGVTEVLYNSAPTDLSLSATTISEITDVGGVVATLSAQDAEGDALTWSLSDPSGTVRLEGNLLRLARALDYESQAHEHTITLTASDAYGGTTSRSVTLSVTNAIESIGLVLTGTPGPDSLTGEAGDDRIAGLGGNDVLTGEAGADRLSGGTGNDQLWGGTGIDSFVFDTRLNKSSNVDVLADFVSQDDHILLDNAIFTKLGRGSAAGVRLKSDMFVQNNKAKDAQDRIVYDIKTGSLYYDRDGTGSAAQVKFATVANKAKLYYHDFLVI